MENQDNNAEIETPKLEEKLGDPASSFIAIIQCSFLMYALTVVFFTLIGAVMAHSVGLWTNLGKALEDLFQIAVMYIAVWAVPLGVVFGIVLSAENFSSKFKTCVLGALSYPILTFLFCFYILSSFAEHSHKLARMDISDMPKIGYVILFIIGIITILCYLAKKKLPKANILALIFGYLSIGISYAVAYCFISDIYMYREWIPLAVSGIALIASLIGKECA